MSALASLPLTHQHSAHTPGHILQPWPATTSGSSRPPGDCRDIDDGGYGLDYSEDIIPDNDNVSNEAQPITGGQSQGIAAQEPKRKKAKSRPASASEGACVTPREAEGRGSSGTIAQDSPPG
ncbi:hypothetical protein ACOMHN_036343 [Nucella lapillus]